MALAEVARAWSLAEARVAQSMLEAAGMTVFVFDEHRAGALWTEQLAIGGIRLMTPMEQAEEASALLRSVTITDASTVGQARPSMAAGLGGLVLLPLCFLFGWSLAGFRRPDLFHKASAACVVAVLLAAMVGFRLVAVLAR